MEIKKIKKPANILMEKRRSIRKYNTSVKISIGKADEEGHDSTRFSVDEVPQ